MCLGDGRTDLPIDEAIDPYLPAFSLRTLTDARASGIRAAVLSTNDADRAFASDAVLRLGHVPVDFPRLEDLVGTLLSGEKFDVVLAAFEGDAKAIRSGARILERVSRGSLPILLMVGKEQLANSNEILEVSFDFVFLPFNSKELEVRLLASLWKDEQLTEKTQRLVFKSFRFEPASRRVYFDEKHAALKRREFDLALFLFRNAGIVQSRELIRREYWPRSSPEASSRTIDVHIANIRRKLDLVRDEADVKISCVSRVGYVLLFN
jgi:DNA-binding response OmpR family regulator